MFASELANNYLLRYNERALQRAVDIGLPGLDIPANTNIQNHRFRRMICPETHSLLSHFYRATHFSAKRGIAIACRLSVCLSVRLSVTLVDCDHIGWNSSKLISQLVSLGCSLFAIPTRRVCSKGNTPKFGPKVTHPLLI